MPGRKAAVLLLSVVFGPASASTPPRPLEIAAWTLLKMLDALGTKVRTEREPVVAASLSRCPASTETFLLALLSEQYQDKLWEAWGDSFGPLDPQLSGQAYPGRRLGLAKFGGAGPHGPVFEKEGARYEIYATIYVSPLLLDLNFDGVPGVAAGTWEPRDRIDFSHCRVFDINGDGFPELTEWVGGTDGLLVRPEDPAKVAAGPEGLIWRGPLSGRDLIGTAEGYRSGFEKLALFDTNGDKVLAGKELAGFYVWRDRDADGVIESGELMPIGKVADSISFPAPGGDVGGFEKNGRRGAVWDWWPSYALARKSLTEPQPDAFSLPLHFLAKEDMEGPVSKLTLAVDETGLLSKEALERAGVDWSTLIIRALSPDGSRLVLFDRSVEVRDIASGRAVALWAIDLSARPFSAARYLLPVVGVQQVVFETPDTVFVIGDNGGKLLLVDLKRHKVFILHEPSEGRPGFRCGLFAWRGKQGESTSVMLTGEFYDAKRASGKKYIARITRSGLEARISALAAFEELQNCARTFGEIRMEFPLGPGFAFFVVRNKAGGKSALVACRNGKGWIVDEPIRLAGIAAEGQRVLYFKEVSPESAEAIVYDAAQERKISLGTGDFCYPYLEDDGRVAVVSKINWASGRMDLFRAEVGRSGLELLYSSAGTGAVRTSEDGRVLAFPGPEGLVIRDIPRPPDSGVFFVRGDANADGEENIADAVHILKYLFAGGAQPPCADSADVNDDSQIDISDPI